VEELVKEGQVAPATGVSLELASQAGLQLWSAPTRINREDTKEAETEEVTSLAGLELWSATTQINLEESKEAEQDEAGQVALVFEEALVSEEPQAVLPGGKKTGRHLHPMRAIDLPLHSMRMALPPVS